jgi:hypothetical protein
MSKNLEADFLTLKEKVLDRRPFLRQIIKKRGKKNLYDYAKEYIEVNLNNPIRKRQDEFINTFKEVVGERLGDRIAKEAAEQFENYYYVSTTDHHGPICHPFFINGNLMAAAPHFEHHDPLLKYVIVLACANISLNNSSYPRGLIFNALKQGRIVEHRVPFFPAKERLCPVYNHRAYTQEDMEKFKQLLGGLVNSGEVPQREADKINEVVDNIFLDPRVLKCGSYSEQITKTNFRLWKEFFGPHAKAAPGLIYLDQEWIVAKLLVKHHLKQDTIINHFLLDARYEPLINHYFEGIMGAFSRNEKYGTYMFWGLPKGAKYRIQLWKEGNFLVSNDGKYKLELTPDNLEKALLDKEIIPGMMLTFVVLSFYYGIKCLGGFSQVDYLTNMKNAYIKMLVDRGNYRSIEVCARAQTKEMCGDMTIAYLGGPSGEMVPATGIDLILYGDLNTWPTLVRESKEIGLEEAINPMMPEFYSIIYNESQRNPALSYITPALIIKHTRLNQKIKACVKIRGPESNQDDLGSRHQHNGPIESFQANQPHSSSAPAMLLKA